MKRNILISLVLVGLIFAACGTKQSGKDPQQEILAIALSFAQDVAEKDFKSCEKYLSQNSIEKLQKLNDADVVDDLAEHFKSFTPDTIKQYATVKYRTSNGVEQELKMEYTAKGWKVLLNEELFLDSPMQVAKMFMKRLLSKEFDDAKQYATKETQFLLSMMGSLISMNKDLYQKMTEKRYDLIEWHAAEIDGDKAIVKYDIDGKTEQLDLVKENDKWKVEFKKETEL